jgi:NhaP-type Na+/H+ or K+/H+ antiporter
MAITIAEFIIFALLADWIFKKFKIPGLVGMLLIGVVMGPFVLDIVSPTTLAISSDLRLIALIVILLSAGLELSKNALKRVGTSALLLASIPPLFEGVAVTLCGPSLLGLTYMESAILGAILSAVSLAVVVPMMIKFISEKKGTEKGLPTMNLAASSLNTVFSIVAYSILIGLYAGNQTSMTWKIAGIPISIILGFIIGAIIGLLLCYLFKHFNPRATKRAMTLIAISILLTEAEHIMENIIPFSALIAVMTTGFIILEKQEHSAHEISLKMGKIWLFAQILLYVLVGTQVDIYVALKAGICGTILIIIGLIARSAGTYLCIIKNNLTMNERHFLVVSQIPKATVQAAIGGAPLILMKTKGMDTTPGNIILAVAVLSILVTAPTGAWLISTLGEKVLKHDTKPGDPPSLTAIKESNDDSTL